MKGNKGITLIALVITIIVLLILAGVSIAMLSGDNSILKQAQSARDKSAEGTLDETVKLAVANIITANLEWPTTTTTGENPTTTTAVTITGTATTETEKSKDLVTQIQTVNPGLTFVSSSTTLTDGKFKIETGSNEPIWTITAMLNKKEQTVKVNSLTGAVTLPTT